MINYGRQSGSARPKEIEITDTSVFLATNIEPYEEEIDGYSVSGYHYNYVQYTKNEYIAKLHEDIINTQLALCDIYETLMGDEE